MGRTNTHEQSRCELSCFAYFSEGFSQTGLNDRHDLDYKGYFSMQSPDSNKHKISKCCTFGFIDRTPIPAVGGDMYMLHKESET